MYDATFAQFFTGLKMRKNYFSFSYSLLFKMIIFDEFVPVVYNNLYLAEWLRSLPNTI